MFQFENEWYQEVLEHSRRGRYAKRRRKSLQDFAEVVEKLEPFEVDFILALRSCERSFRAEIASAVLMFHHNRFDFYRLLSVMLTADCKLQNIANPCGVSPHEGPTEGGTGETPTTHTQK